MTQKKASDYFHKEDDYNCAQAILKNFQSEYSISQEMIDSYSAYGGGRAENGQCGAFYAAKNLLNNPNKIELLNKEFLKKAGSVKCKGILKLKKLPCADCVDLAAKIVDGSKQ
jgi:hypothetical protein